MFAEMDRQRLALPIHSELFQLNQQITLIDIIMSTRRRHVVILLSGIWHRYLLQ